MRSGNHSIPHRAAIFAAALTASVTAACFAAAPATTQPAATQPTAAQLEAEIQALQNQVKTLQSGEQNVQRSEESAAEVRQIVKQVLSDAKTRSEYMGNDLEAGYNNGFFIQSANKEFNLTINGYLQYRYTWSQAQRGNNVTDTGSPIPSSDIGNSNGFDARRARLILSGYAFKNIIYSISGDFASGSGLGNSFQILDTWVGYKFNPGLMIRAGSMLVPFTHVEYYSSGTEFPEFAAAEAPFDPVRSLALDVSGNVDNNKLFYDAQINNGSKANSLDGSANVSASPNIDNRMGFYARVQYAGAGTNADFTDSPDVSWHKHLVWAIGAAAGYEEQNSSAGVYPAPQTSLALAGLATPDAGYLPGVTASGSLYRATVDGHLKYRGLALNGAVYYQQYNAATPGAGDDTALLYKTYGTGSVWQLGAYGEAGYFIVPHRWELAARIGDLTTDGQGKQSMEYTAGVNYYIFGENAKIQTAFTYLPNAAYSSPNIGANANTQDFITQVQLQVKF